MSPASSFLAPPERGSKPAPPAAPDELQDLVAQVILEWRADSAAVEFRPTTREVLDRHPQLERHQSLVLDLAVEEYCLRRDRGAPVDPVAFAAQFPHAGQALGSVLAFYEQNASAFDIPDSESTTTTTWPTAGKLFAGLLLLQEIGRGCNSRVFLASELSVGQRLVVLKVSLGISPEPTILGRLRHPQIVPILSVATLEAPCSVPSARSIFTLIVMPFRGRTTLADMIRTIWGSNQRPVASSAIRMAALEGALGEPSLGDSDSATSVILDDEYACAIVQIMIGVADALHYAHQQGICHRDIKPSNILMTPQCHPLIMDFNASTSENSSSLTVAGTLAYMAPERLEEILRTPRAGAQMLRSDSNKTSSALNSSRISSSRRVSDIAAVPFPILLGLLPSADRGDQPELSDVFSLGAVLYEALTGRPPFGTPDTRQTVRRQAAALYHRQQKSPILRSRSATSIDDDLFRIIDRCLSPVPSQRPLTALALADDLRAYLNVQQCKRGTAARKCRKSIALSVAIVVASLLLVLGGYSAWERSRDALDMAIRQYEEGEFRDAADTLTRGIAALSERRAKDATQDERDLFLAKRWGAMHFVRAQCFLRLGKAKEAEADLGEAIVHDRSPSVAIPLAYTKGSLGNDRDAMAVYEMIIEDMGVHRVRHEIGGTIHDRILVLNNCALHCTRCDRPGTALKYLKTARGFADETALFEIVVNNQANVLIQLASAVPVDPQEISSLETDICKLARRSENGGRLFLTAARLASCRYSITHRSEDKEAVVGHMLEAVGRGVKYDDVLSDAMLRKHVRSADLDGEVGSAAVDLVEACLIEPEIDVRRGLLRFSVQ